MSKKVLMLSHSSELGGSERSMLDIFDCWAKEDYVEPHFIIRRPLQNIVPELKKRSWPYTALYYNNWSQRNPPKRAEGIFQNADINAKAVFDIEQLIKDIKPDIVMTNTIVAPWAAIAAHFQGVPHVWFVREYGDIDHQHVIELGKKKMLEDIDTLSDFVVTNSKTLKDHVAKYMSAAKITPLYTPFDLKALERKSQEPVEDPFKDRDSLKLVITGKIAKSKGQHEAAEAVGLLNEQGHKTELCVIGAPAESDDDDALKQAIAKHGLEDKVHLVGKQPNPLAIISKADVGVMASRQEAFGRVTFEYMATGRPVVGADSGATPEMVEHGKNGLLYEQGNARSLTEQLTKYAKDKPLIKKHGDAARAKAEAMMKGEYNADSAFHKIESAVSTRNNKTNRPLHFSHRWLEYPAIARQYIEDFHSVSVRRIVYLRLRQRAKWVYLRLPDSLQKIIDHARRLAGNG